MKDLSYWQERMKLFAQERDWEQFHSPKNITMALSVECSELMELFQWLDGSDLKGLTALKSKEDFEGFKERVEEEIADVFLYWARFCDLMEIDVPAALEKKMLKNAQKYPIEKSKGNATKYNQL